MNFFYDELLKVASTIAALLAACVVGAIFGWIKKKSSNQTIERYMPILENFVSDAVRAASQSSVEAVKKMLEDGEISKEEKATMLENIKKEVGDDIRAIAPNYILEFFEEVGVDVTKLIETLIEKYVLNLKESKG